MVKIKESEIIDLLNKKTVLKNELNLKDKSNFIRPIFTGSTGGWLRSAEVEEKYAITWTMTNKEQIFEMPTGGAAIMQPGENILYLARKEQCLALATQLRTFKINLYKIYRLFPTGEVQYLHPKDGIFPEKVNPGRIPTNNRDFSIGKNPNPASIKFSGNSTYEI